MKCPACKNQMIVLELNKIEIDYCPKCKGIWLDEGELELLTGNHENAIMLLETLHIDYINSEKSRRCPRCTKKMYKVYIGENKDVLLDKCRNNHGLWFDSGELNDVIRLGKIDEDNKVLHLLEDMFDYELKK